MDILDFLTNSTLFRHELPQAIHHCRPTLREQFPDLAAIDCASLGRGFSNEFLVAVETEFGMERKVKRPQGLAYPARDQQRALRQYLRPEWGTPLVPNEGNNEASGNNSMAHAPQDRCPTSDLFST